MKNKIIIFLLLFILLFIGFNIYNTIDKTIIAESDFNLINEECNTFKFQSVNYDYRDIVDFSQKYDGIRLKTIKNSKDSILANFYFEGSLDTLDIFLIDFSKISNLKSISNITLEKENNIFYKGEIASEFIIKFNWNNFAFLLELCWWLDNVK